MPAIMIVFVCGAVLGACKVCDGPQLVYALLLAAIALGLLGMRLELGRFADRLFSCVDAVELEKTRSKGGDGDARL